MKVYNKAPVDTYNQVRHFLNILSSSRLFLIPKLTEQRHIFYFIINSKVQSTNV